MSDKNWLQRLFEGLIGSGRKQRGMGLSQIMEQLWQQLETMLVESGEWSYLVEMFIEDDAIFAILARGGRLWRAAVTVDTDTQTATLGEVTEVEPLFVPVRSQTRVIRQAGVSPRWISISATAVLNRVGEIDSADLFRSFVTQAEETGDYGFRTLMHEEERLRTGTVDFLAVDEHVFITSGVFDTELGQIEAAALEANPDGYEESIGYYATRAADMEEVIQGVSVPVYRAGIFREVSGLKQGMAASLFTRPTVIKERDMKDATMKLVQQLFVDAGRTEEDAAEFIATVDETNRSIEDERLITRATDDAEASGGDTRTEAEAEAGDEAEPQPALELELDEAMRARVAEALASDAGVQAQLAAAFRAVVEGALAPVLERLNALDDEAADVRQGQVRLATQLRALEQTAATNAADVQQHLAPGASRLGVRLVVPRQRQADDAPDGDDNHKPTAAAVAADTLARLPKVTVPAR